MEKREKIASCFDLKADRISIIIVPVLKKAALSGLVILVFIFYVVHQKQEDANVKIIAPSPIPTSSSASAPSVAPSTAITQPAPTSIVSQNAYHDGRFTGDVADAFYGLMQVEVVISGGKITDVVFLQYPNDRETTIAINSQAMPLLRQEAIQKQASNVDIITGATQSSEAFIQSLRSALVRAHS